MFIPVWLLLLSAFAIAPVAFCLGLVCMACLALAGQISDKEREWM